MVTVCSSMMEVGRITENHPPLLPSDCLGFTPQKREYSFTVSFVFKKIV